MSCGDSGLIVLTIHSADDLSELEEWRPLLHELGACETKHGAELSVVNLYGDDAGNPELPKKFQLIKQQNARRRAITIAAALIAVIAFAALGIWFSRDRKPHLAATEKSIAVLPFEN